jgi:hypothetical protein
MSINVKTVRHISLMSDSRMFAISVMDIVAVRQLSFYRSSYDVVFSHGFSKQIQIAIDEKDFFRADAHITCGRDDVLNLMR